MQKTFPSLLFFSLMLCLNWNTISADARGGRPRPTNQAIATALLKKISTDKDSHKESSASSEQELHINGDQYTILQTACLTRDVAIVGEVLEHDHSIINKAIDRNWNTPLLIACGVIGNFISPKVAELLINAGADVNAANKNGDTALHMVSTCDCKQTASSLISLLIKHGADVNAQNTTLVTPLHNTCGGRYACAAEILLAHGAKTDIKNSDGETPIDIAIKHKNNAVVAKLKTHELRRLSSPSVEKAAAQLDKLSIQPVEKNDLDENEYVFVDLGNEPARSSCTIS